ncbi:MAG: prohibitin 1, partial [Psychromonas sp.]
MENIEIEAKKVIKYATIGVGGLILVIIFFMSWQDVNPGEEGFVYRPYGDGVETQNIYKEGTNFLLPWNRM